MIEYSSLPNNSLEQVISIPVIHYIKVWVVSWIPETANKHNLGIRFDKKNTIRTNYF
jgi:hypothetical protein